MKRSVALLAMVLFASCSIATVASAQQAWNSITLTWTTPGDDSLSGTATQFDIRYSTSPITAANFSSATRWTSGVPTPLVSGTQQSVQVTGLTAATTYYFAMKTADDAGNWSGISNTPSKTTSVAPDVTRPAPIAMTITGQTDTTVTVQWTAVGDDSLTGTATTYDLRYSTAAITAANFSSASTVSNEPAPAVAGTVQSVTVHGLSRQVTYYFAIKVADEVPNWSGISNVPSVTTPDTMPPAAITNLALGLFWLDFSAALPPKERLLKL